MKSAKARVGLQNINSGACVPPPEMHGQRRRLEYDDL